MKVFQIYYSPEQLAQIEFEPYFNENCNVFFEHQVMCDLVQQGKHLDESYFGVVSYKLRDKIQITKNNWRNTPLIANSSVTEYDTKIFVEELYKKWPDVMSFQRHQGHDPISLANKFHPKFAKYFKEIMLKVGHNWRPTHFDNVFYCNYFVARSEIYDQYIKDMLLPAMEVMKGMPELMGNSNYPHPLPEHLKKSFGVDHYPYHTFLCERMFSYFAHINKLKCLHY